MIEDEYLTDDRKNYYMSDFRNLLSINDSEFWDIDDGLENILQKINATKEFQTLYSKWFQLTPGFFNIGGESYLHIAYVKGAKDKLLQLLYKVNDTTICENCKISIIECSPSDNANYKADSKLQIGCNNNSNYFRINHINITIESLKIECHNLFWMNMNLSFENLNLHPS